MPLSLPRVPRSCFWEITYACNLRCIHCESSSGQAAADELSPAEALTVAEQLAEIGCREVLLTGGEPLVRPDWEAIAERLVQLGASVGVISNGLRLSTKVIARLVSLGVKGVSLSLDGDRAVHDRIRVPAHGSASSYDAVVAAIERAVASPLKTAVITQVHRGNLDDLSRMYEQLVRLGLDVWQVQICMPLGRLLDYRALPHRARAARLPHEQLAGFIHDGRMRIAMADNIGYYGKQEPVLRGAVAGGESFWTGCVAGCQVIAICPNGDVKGCPSHPREFVVGSIRQTPLATIWGEAERFAYNTRWDERLLEGACETCPQPAFVSCRMHHHGLRRDRNDLRQSLLRAALLIIDDVGLGQVKKRADEPTAAHTLFNLIDKRHGHASTAFSSNIKLSARGRYLGDPTLAAAILDRTTMSAIRLDITGPSYRQHVAQQRAKKRGAKLPDDDRPDTDDQL